MKWRGRIEDGDTFSVPHDALKNRPLGYDRTLKSNRLVSVSLPSVPN